MKPIIKWPGGKSRELARIREYLPPHDTWVEPFVGGGAFFFRLEPSRAFLNDAEKDLVDFYRAVRMADPYLETALLTLAADREELAARAGRRAGGFESFVALARTREAAGDATALAKGAGDAPLSLSAEGLEETIAASIRSKVSRLLGLERKHDRVFGPDELPQHFETALQAGYYTAVRDRFRPGSRAEELARFYFLRELCYGSMFRYSKTGKFNIPYGGISYNRADFRAKADRLYSGAVRSLLFRAELCDGDFADHLESVEEFLGPDAFVFLDPPYDTEFSNYANRAFGREEQERLARVFSKLPCPALLVIQETEYIRSLYDEVRKEREAKGKPIFLTTYGKTYGYNVRGRNERKTRHLLVGNYTLPGYRLGR